MDTSTSRLPSICISLFYMIFVFSVAKANPFLPVWGGGGGEGEKEPRRIAF